MSKTMNRVGFTLVELTIALSILVLIGGVGSQFDLVDLLDKEEYLADNGLKLDTPSLIARLEAAPKDGDGFLTQVVCSELGDRGNSVAMPQLNKLVHHDDFFVSKRAKLAIDRIRSAKKQQTASILERIRPMLPEKSKLAFDAGRDFKSNADHTQNLFRPGLQNETLSLIQKKIGNAQVDSLQVVSLNEDRNSFLVLATGHFYQKKVSESLQEMTFKMVV